MIDLEKVAHSANELRKATQTSLDLSQDKVKELGQEVVRVKVHIVERTRM